MKLPYKQPGLGWIFAAIALVLGLLGLVGIALPIPNLVMILIILLALAILL